MEQPARRQPLKKGYESARLGGKRSESTAVSLRKTVKARLLQRRRGDSGGVEGGGSALGLGASVDKAGAQTPQALSSEEDAFIQDLQGTQMVDKIKEQVGVMMSAVDEQVRFRATLFIRKLSSRKHEPPLYDIAAANGIDAAGAVLQYSEHMPSRVSAAWILTNIASDQRELVRLLFEKDMIRHLIDGFKSPHFELHDQCLWALANIAGDHSDTCDLLRRPPYAIVPLVANFALSTTHAADLNYCRNTAWLMSNLCRKHKGNGQLVALLPALAHYLEHHDTDVLVDVTEALRWYTEEDEGAAAQAKKMKQDPHPELTALVNHPTLLPRLVRRLSEHLVSVDHVPEVKTAKKIPSTSEEFDEEEDHHVVEQAACLAAARTDIAENLLKTLANVAAGTDYQTDRLLLAGAMPVLEQALLHPAGSVVQEVCYILSNFATGSDQQIQRLLNVQLLRTLAVIAHERNAKVQNEALFVFVNIGQYGTTAQVRWFVEHGEGLPQVCQALEAYNLKLIACALSSIQNILRLGTSAEVRQHFKCANKYAELVEEFNGLEKIHQLQANGNTSISDKAFEILDTFFDQDPDDPANAQASSPSSHRVNDTHPSLLSTPASAQLFSSFGTLDANNDSHSFPAAFPTQVFPAPAFPSPAFSTSSSTLAALPTPAAPAFSSQWGASSAGPTTVPTSTSTFPSSSSIFGAPVTTSVPLMSSLSSGPPSAFLSSAPPPTVLGSAVGWTLPTSSTPRFSF